MSLAGALGSNSGSEAGRRRLQALASPWVRSCRTPICNRLLQALMRRARAPSTQAGREFAEPSLRTRLRFAVSLIVAGLATASALCPDWGHREVLPSRSPSLFHLLQGSSSVPFPDFGQGFPHGQPGSRSLRTGPSLCLGGATGQLIEVPRAASEAFGQVRCSRLAGSCWCKQVTMR